MSVEISDRFEPGLSIPQEQPLEKTVTVLEILLTACYGRVNVLEPNELVIVVDLMLL